MYRPWTSLPIENTHCYQLNFEGAASTPLCLPPANLCRRGYSDFSKSSMIFLDTQLCTDLQSTNAFPIPYLDTTGFEQVLSSDLKSRPQWGLAERISMPIFNYTSYY